MIVLDNLDKRPIYEQIVDRFKELIVLGVMAKDEKMPSVRQLAIELSINPNTIQRAYIELERAGFIYSVKGKGNFVADASLLMPERKQKFFNKLDDLLDQANGYAVTYEDINEHIMEYFETSKKGE